MKDKKKQSQKCGCEICKKYTQQEKDKEEIAKVREENDKLWNVIRELHGLENMHSNDNGVIDTMVEQGLKPPSDFCSFSCEQECLQRLMGDEPKKIHYSDRLPTAIEIKSSQGYRPVFP